MPKTNDTVKGMSSEQLRDEVMTIFLAEHKTTANMLSWTSYLLIKNPDVERKLHQEFDDVLCDRVPG